MIRPAKAGPRCPGASRQSALGLSPRALGISSLLMLRSIQISTRSLYWLTAIILPREMRSRQYQYLGDDQIKPAFHNMESLQGYGSLTENAEVAGRQSERLR